MSNRYGLESGDIVDIVLSPELLDSQFYELVERYNTSQHFPDRQGWELLSKAGGPGDTFDLHAVDDPTVVIALNANSSDFIGFVLVEKDQ